MAVVFLGLGSNLGDPKANLCEAVERLSGRPDIRLQGISSLYLTAPVGYTDQPDFINAVAVVETELTPLDLLDAAHEIEGKMGGTRNFRYGPRVIDIDVLLYDSATVAEPDLTVPHPRMMERAFVMEPLTEIAPDLVLPGGKTPGEVLRALDDQGVVRLPETDQWRCSDMK